MMPAQYFDIETNGLSPKDSRIITIQHQPISRGLRSPAGKLNILEAFDPEDEFAILADFVDSGYFNMKRPWDFIPVGFNLSFEAMFLHGRLAHYGFEEAKLPPYSLVTRPQLDLHHIAVAMNRGEWKGTKLEDMSMKETSGHVVLEKLKEGDHEGIRDYIKQETKSFLEMLRILVETLPEYRRKVYEPRMTGQLAYEG